MHIDTRNLGNNTLIEGDVCIIGAGAAGISIAIDWIDTPYKVILLESGGFEYEAEIQALNAGKTSGQRYYPLQSTRLRFFGGTTGHWGGMCAPFDEIDFKVRDYVPHSGWPIKRKDLDPYYARAQKTLKLGPYNYNYEYWKGKKPKQNAFPLDKEVIWNKMWQIKAARYGELYKDQIVSARNIHLYTYANAVEISSNDAVSNIEEVVVKNQAGKTHKVKAKYFIMACGAVQNARLLLSSDKQAPMGLGNDKDVVGRYFMEHIEITAGELWLFDPFETDLYSRGFTRAELAITEKIQRKYKFHNGTIQLTPLNVGKHIKPMIETWQDDDPRKSHDNNQNRSLLSKIARFKTRLWEPTAFQMECRIEQAPNPNSRVTLDTERDTLGVRKPHLHWELGFMDKFSIRKLQEVIGQQFGLAQLGRVKLEEFLRDEQDTSFPEQTNGGFHHMGTTRMSDDPSKGVVNANCQVHGISNLFVAGSGCFATSGAPNPTLTLVALSHRLSDHVKARVKADLL